MVLKKIYFILLSICFFTQAKQQTPIDSQIAQIAATADPHKLDVARASDQFVRVTTSQQARDENAKIPANSPDTFRIMTYNIYAWKNAAGHCNQTTLDDIVDVIQRINPDLIVLQEVSPEPGWAKGGSQIWQSPSMQLLARRTGLVNYRGCKAIDEKAKGWAGNVLALKTPFEPINRYWFTPNAQFRAKTRRCFLSTKTNVRGVPLNVYGTHLEVRYRKGLLTNQLNEIIDQMHKDHIFGRENALIAGDFNATRGTNAVRRLQAQGFVDCFTKKGWALPLFTNWTGKEIDFIFLSPNWNLPIAGCYVYYSPASDHLPVIMDIDLKAAAADAKKIDFINKNSKKIYKCLTK